MNGLGVMENEPKRIPEILLNVGDKKYILTPENTLASLYEQQEYDYVFYITEETDDTYYGYYIFRHLLGNDFDILIRRMIDSGYTVNNEDEISETDYKAYLESLPKEIKTVEVSSRGEAHINFLHYLLEKELLIDEEFKGNGELYL